MKQHETAEISTVNIITEEDSPENHVVIHDEKASNSKIKIIWHKISYAVLPFLIFLIVQELAYSGNMFLGKPGAHPEIWLDKHIPVVSQFIWVYYLTFPLAIFCFFWVSAKNEKRMWNVWLTAVIAFAISGIIYFFWQTEMVKPDFTPVTISDKFMVWTWNATKPINCFPSQHCFMAISIVLCMYNIKDGTPAWLRWTCYVISVLIFMATVFLRQHYVLDLISALVIMLPIYFIIKACKFGDKMVLKRQLKKQDKDVSKKANEDKM